MRSQILPRDWTFLSRDPRSLPLHNEGVPATLLSPNGRRGADFCLPPGVHPQLRVYQRRQSNGATMADDNPADDLGNGVELPANTKRPLGVSLPPRRGSPHPPHERARGIPDAVQRSDECTTKRRRRSNRRPSVHPRLPPVSSPRLPPPILFLPVMRYTPHH